MDETRENELTGLSRRGFFGAGAAVAAGGAALLTGASPAFGATSPDGSDGVQAAGDVSTQAAPSVVPGATMRTADLFSFQAFETSPGAVNIYVAGATGVYSGGALGTIGAHLDLPTGAVLKQIDCYGIRATSGQQSWGLWHWDLNSSSAEDLPAIGSSPTGTGLLQATISTTQTVLAGHTYAVILGGSSANNIVRGVAYQYFPPELGYVPVTPFRAYDSRWGGGAGPIFAPASRVVTVAHAHNIDTGATTVTNVVPVGASAVSFNLTIVDTAGSGFLAVVPGDASGFGSSTINWSADGQVLANASNVNIDAARGVKVFSGGSGGTHFIIDVTGYYR